MVKDWGVQPTPLFGVRWVCAKKLDLACIYLVNLETYTILIDVNTKLHTCLRREYGLDYSCGGYVYHDSGNIGVFTVYFRSSVGEVPSEYQSAIRTAIIAEVQHEISSQRGARTGKSSN